MTTGNPRHRESSSRDMTLLDLQPGKTGIITRIGGHGRLRHRLLDLGLHLGEKVTMVKTAPFRDPVEFALNGSHISLRRSEAELIRIHCIDCK